MADPDHGLPVLAPKLAEPVKIGMVPGRRHPGAIQEQLEILCLSLPEEFFKIWGTVPGGILFKALLFEISQVGGISVSAMQLFGHQDDLATVFTFHLAGNTGAATFVPQGANEYIGLESGKFAGIDVPYITQVHQ